MSISREEAAGKAFLNDTAKSERLNYSATTREIM
jgi:hypothetical protein